MSKKLFSTEDVSEGTPEEVVLESSPEVGEAADAQLEVLPDEQSVDDLSDSVDQGFDAIDQLLL